DAPDLARHYPTTGGDGDAAATWGPFAALLADRHDAWGPALAHPPQTNEVGRSVALLAGLLTLRQAIRLPVRLLALGASAGPNVPPRMRRWRGYGSSLRPRWCPWSCG